MEFWALDTKNEEGYMWLGREPVFSVFKTEEAANKYRDALLKKERKKYTDGITSYTEDLKFECSKEEIDVTAINRISTMLDRLSANLKDLNAQKHNAIWVYKIIVHEHEGEALL